MMTNLTQMVKAANLQDMIDRLVLADMLEENGREQDATLLRTHCGQLAVAPDGSVLPAEELQTRQAKELHEALLMVRPGSIPVLAEERSLPRKEQAKLARKLFKSLGLPHVRFTTPNYSMASTVEVSYPTRRDYTVRDESGRVDFQNDPVSRANTYAESLLRDILSQAFPNHDDRSDSMTDYYNAKWSFIGQ